MGIERRSLAAIGLWLGLGLVACDPGAGRPGGLGGGLAPASGTDTDAGPGPSNKDDDADPGSTGGSDPSDEGTDGDPGGASGSAKFDLGSQPDGGMAAPDECTKVDVLFMIDNSGSMANEQANLIAAFPGFVSGMQTALEHAESYHVGIVTSDSYDNNGGGCRGLGDLVAHDQCGGHASGYRWFDDSEPDLAATFACEAAVGTSGDSGERQVAGALRAVEPSRNAPGACNDGFIRDDALLVVVLITDEEDEEDCTLFGLDCDGGSPDGPGGWFDTLVGHKGGIEENIVVLSLVGRSGSDCAERADRIENFTERFTSHALGEICAGGYDTFFAEAIAQIDTACQDFTPPG